MGFRYYIKNDKVILKVKNQTKKRFKKKLKNINALLDKHFITNKYYLEVKNSYIAHLNHGNCSKLIYLELSKYKNNDYYKIGEKYIIK